MLSVVIEDDGDGKTFCFLLSLVVNFLVFPFECFADLDELDLDREMKLHAFVGRPVQLLLQSKAKFFFFFFLASDFVFKNIVSSGQMFAQMHAA